MAEDESGFTFVDKRRAVADEEVDADDNSVNEASSDLAGDDYAADSTVGESPSTYVLLQYCVSLLATDAWQKLGLVPDPSTGKPGVDLTQAKVAIDTVGDLIARLETASDVEVPATARREMRNLLNDLRLNYVNQRSASGTAG